MASTGQDQSIQIDPAKLEKAIAQYGVGSILNVKDQALPVDKWHEIIGQIQAAAQKTRLKIPVIYGIDSIHGANYMQCATLFPQEIGMTATWNLALMQRAADKAQAILLAYNPSNEGGHAAADVLFGDYNPSGKLPFTYPRTPNSLITYDHKQFESEQSTNPAFQPQFEFGRGLSYTNFTYSNL